MLFFDLDGTITDSNRLWAQVDEEFLGRRGLNYTPEYQEYIIHCIFDTAAGYTREYYGLKETEEQIKDEWLMLARKHYAQVDLKPGAAEYLCRCRQEGRRMAIITSCMREQLEKALECTGC
jgi:beta-phosphoglucomutase-like phosphatase (HAD superfamily)